MEKKLVQVIKEEDVELMENWTYICTIYKIQ